MKANANLTVMMAIVMGMVACKKSDQPDPKPEPTPIETVSLSITELKAKSTGESVTLTEANKLFKVKGVVVSDNGDNGKNIDAKTAVLVQEDNSVGIVVNFDAAHSFVTGTEVEIGVSNQKLVNKNGEIVLDAIPLDSAKTTASSKVITPKETTISAINDNKAAWNGTLVSIAATAYSSADGKYKGTLTITDVSGTISSEVLAGASFENNNLLQSVSKVTGIVRVVGETAFLNVRNLSDLVIGNISSVITEDFTVWINANTTSNGSYSIKASNGHASLQVPVSAFDPSFTDANKKYPLLVNPHIAAQGVNGYLLTERFLSPGLKTVTVTFAASTAKALIPYRELTGLSAPSFIPAEFDPSKDVVKIGFSVGRNNESRPIHQSVPIFESAEFKEVGKWYTVKFNVPTREELIAAGATEAVADNIIGAIAANPQIGIFNLSTRSTGLGENGITPFLSAPIIIDKIVYGY